MARSKAYPKGLELIREAIQKERNVANFPNSERTMWLDFMPSPPDIRGKEKAEVVYFVGCMASFSPQIQSIPSAMAELLEKAGVDFLVLGEREWCCGYPFFTGGLGREAEELIEHNTRAIEGTGAEAVLFSCPSCYRTFKEHYSLDAELLHHTQFIDRLIGEGKIKPERVGRKLTYHDPCDLGRHSGVYREPRKVIGSLPGAEFAEMERRGEFSVCCGGGGDLELINPELTDGISGEVIGEAKKTGAEALITACQQCKRVIQKGVKNRRREDLEVLDIAELLVESLKVR